MNLTNLNILLQERAPDAIADLRVRFPDAAEQFRDDKTLRADTALGHANLSNANAPSIAAAQLAHIEVSVPVLRAELDKNLDKLGSTLRAARRIQFVASAVTAASSAGLVTAILKIGPLAGETQAISLSGISFVSSMLALSSDMLSGGKEFDSRALFDQCTSMSRELLDVELKAKRAAQGAFSAETFEKLLDRLDDVAVGVQEARIKLKLR